MDKFQQAQAEHSALTQYYRWYQVYEVPFTAQTILNQQDILHSEVEIVTQQGTVKGKENLADRLKVYEGWSNAHHVKSTSVRLLENGEIQLEADILYQNIRPDESRYSYTIHYNTLLERRDNDLPVFTKVEIQPTGIIEDPKFKSAYVINRAQSFVNYWLYCMETANGSAEKFKELLAVDFELNLKPYGLITTFAGLTEWLQSLTQLMKQCGYTAKNFSTKENSDGSITVSAGIDLWGISEDDQNIIAETQHEWVLENNTEDRFAKLKKMNVTDVLGLSIIS